MLTQERVRELFDYREDGELIWKANQRGRVKAGDVAGYLSEGRYRKTSVDGRRYWTHRVVFLYHHGYMPENQVDHTDRNPGNNRIENLREASQSCNMRNAKVSVANTSGVTGVGWYAAKERWVAQIMVQNKNIYLGHFADFTEAVAHRFTAEQCLGWEGCHSSTTAYLHMKEYMEEKNDTNRHSLTASVVTQTAVFLHAQGVRQT